MPRIRTIPRVFLSYARGDRDLVERLASDLQRAGIAVWADFEGLELGAPDWEAEIRDALEESFAVLLIASPASRKSPYVRSELLLAESRQLPTYAVWMAGEDWIDSIPLKLAHTQYQDFRGTAYADNLALLTAKLSEHGDPVPTHFMYASFYTKVVRGGPRPRASRKWGGASSYDVFTKKGSDRFVEIRVSDVFRTLHNQDSMDALFVNPSAYQSLAHLLDDIYVNYLSERYSPFSYGRDWHLRRGYAAVQLAVDWWFTDGRRQDQDAGNLIAGPSRFRLSPGSVWEIADGMPSYTVSLAAYDEWLIDAITRQPKSSVRLMEMYMTAVNADAFARANFDFVVVVTEFFFRPPGQFLNKLLIQTSDCTSEVKRRWTHW